MMKQNSGKWCLKPVSLLLAAVMVCGMVGCDKSGNPDSITDNSDGVSSESDVFEPLPVPDGGWKVESLAKTIRINGKPLPEPFTVDNLGEGYEVKIDDGASFLYYNEKCIGHVRPNNPSGGVDNNKDLNGFAIWEEISDDNECILFNGIHLGSTMTEVESALGRPTVEFDVGDQYFWDFTEAGYDDENYFFIIYIDKSTEAVSLIAFYPDHVS